MESSDETKDIPINEEFPELDEPGCRISNYHKFIIDSFIEKFVKERYDPETFERKMREATEYMIKKSQERGPGGFPCL